MRCRLPFETKPMQPLFGRGKDADGTLGERVAVAEFNRTQGQRWPLTWRKLRRRSVERVAEDGMARCEQVDADLMLSAGGGMRFD